jgi:annexin A7/11
VRGIVAVLLVIPLAACGPKKQKAELIYEEPVTHVWSGDEPVAAPQPTGQRAAPPAPADVAAPNMQQAPTQTYPPAGSYPPAQAMPRGYPSPAQAMPPATAYPQQQYPPQGQYPPQQYPPQQAYPQQQYPPAGQAPPPGGWRSAQPAPQPPPTGFPDASVTTTVVPDPNPTTQTTLKRRTGWVRGGYD